VLVIIEWELGQEHHQHQPWFGGGGGEPEGNHQHWPKGHQVQTK